MSNRTTVPLRRSPSGLVQKEIAGELMLFNPATKKTHCLNAAAAVIWQHADGATSVEDLAILVAEKTGTPTDIRVVEYALRKLDQEGLIEHVDEPSNEDANLGRRQLFNKLGWAAALIVGVPLISTMSAPKAYALRP